MASVVTCIDASSIDYSTIVRMVKDSLGAARDDVQSVRLFVMPTTHRDIYLPLLSASYDVRIRPACHVLAIAPASVVATITPTRVSGYRVIDDTTALDEFRSKIIAANTILQYFLEVSRPSMTCCAVSAVANEQSHCTGAVLVDGEFLFTHSTIGDESTAAAADMLLCCFLQLIKTSDSAGSKRGLKMLFDSSNKTLLDISDRVGRTVGALAQYEVDILQVSTLDPPPSCLCGGGSSSTPGPISHVFVLAGQSNMSGRGAPDEYVSSVLALALASDDDALVDYASSLGADYVSESKERTALFFDPVEGWQPLLSPLNPEYVPVHRGVDTLKMAGIGPADTFAPIMQRLLERGSGYERSRVGLVPAAVGGSSLAEWMPSYVAPLPVACLDDIDGHDENSAATSTRSHSAMFAPAAVPSYYGSGSVNHFSCAMRSLRLAMEPAGPAAGAAIGGLLWMQGETDACLSAEAAGSAYGDGVENLLRAFRKCSRAILQASSRNGGLDEIPIAVVAVTSTRSSLLHLRSIRKQTLALTQRVPCCVADDAFGLPLKDDSIHLCTLAQVSLGVSLARIIAPKLLPGGSPFDPELQQWKQWLREAADAYSLLRAQAPQAAPAAALSGGVLPVLRSGVKAINFVYGEVDFECMLQIFRTIWCLQRARGTDCGYGTFVDLGCGSGGVLCAALMSRTPQGAYSFSSVLGIDLLQTRIRDCEAVLVAAEEAGFTAGRAATAVYGNFASEPWLCPAPAPAAPPTIYCCATCLSEDLLLQLLRRFEELPIGSYIIIIDSHVLSQGLGFNEPYLERGGERVYRPLCSAQCRASWGEACALVYEKVL